MMHSGSIHTDTNEARLYRYLRERSGQWFTTMTLIHEVGICNPATHIAGVRRGLGQGAGSEAVEHRQEGRLHYYRHVYAAGHAGALDAGAWRVAA